MDFIQLIDWQDSDRDIYFVKEDQLDNCTIEKILRNKFHNPLYQNEGKVENNNKIDWDEVFSKSGNNAGKSNQYIPGLHMRLQYLKLSALTAKQHHQCLKVLSSQNPNVLPEKFLGHPTYGDNKEFKNVKEVYEKEQKEYIEWARTLWRNGHCIRALRPKPIVEMVYEAEFKIRSHKMQSFPKKYHMAAQLPLESQGGEFELVQEKTLVHVPLTDLPLIDCPKSIDRKMTVIKPVSTPEPCNKHPCRFVLPGEKQLTILPLTEVHRELAQYAVDHGAQFVASENALRCFVETDRQWYLPVSVCAGIQPDGEPSNIVILGSEFTLQRESARIRTYRSFKRLLEHALVPLSERARVLVQNDLEDIDSDEEVENIVAGDANMSCDDDDDDDEQLFIDTGENNENDTQSSNEQKNNKNKDNNDDKEHDDNAESKPGGKTSDTGNIGVYTCLCKESLAEKPPPRSYEKWKVVNKTSNQHHDVIVHCSHKARTETEEVIVEPIPEYQVEVGGSAQSPHALRSLALALKLRGNATLVNVRVEGQSGDMVTVDHLNLEDLHKMNSNILKEVSNVLHTALSQLQGLLPGNYVLEHQVNHGPNAMLFAPQGGLSGQPLSLEFDCAQLAEADEAQGVKVPPNIVPVLLPYHKFRRILPCAFTYYEKLVAKERKRPVAKTKSPPEAIKLGAETTDSGNNGKWPKRKRKRKPKKN